VRTHHGALLYHGTHGYPPQRNSDRRTIVAGA